MLSSPLQPNRFTIDGDQLIHIVYDLSIENIDERKAKAKQFDNALQVAKYLGCTPKRVFNNRIPGKRIFSDLMNREFAVRIDQQKNRSK
jgi:hypothetical protein